MKQKLGLYKILGVLTILVVSAGAAAGSAFAQEPDSELSIFIEYGFNCGDGAAEVEFSVSWEPAEVDSYLFFMDFGDGETTDIFETEGSTLTLKHTYIDQGDYEIYVQVGEIAQVMGLTTSGLTGEQTEILTLEGPEVTLLSAPAPPVFVVGEDGQVTFTAETTGGTEPYAYEWDLGGGEITKSYTSETATATYTEEGKYEVQTTVTDKCGFTASVSMPVVVADPEEACHPTAQKIADAVSTLFPGQAGQEYTCEDIYTMFDNEEGGNNLGFGRMWMAYKLADSIDLAWETIKDWHMDQSGWGSLLQLNRFAETLGEAGGIGDLMALVMSEDYTLADVRTAVRSVTRFEADFDDALARIAAGASPGDLSQFYSLAATLGADYETLDGYLADGMTLSELKHAANFAERIEVDWTEIADFRSYYGDSWGDLKQAYSLATAEDSPAEILAMGVQEFREEQRADKTAARLGEQYGFTPEEVMAMFTAGECEGSWSCVRKALREGVLEADGGLTDRDTKTALQIGSKYGFGEDVVLAYYQGACEMDWACTRAYFRDMYMDNKETNKPDK